MSIEPGQRKVEGTTVLRAYQAIVDHGTREDDGYRLGPLRASADFDGYTVTLTDDVVTVRQMFHNKVAIDAPNGRALEAFNARLQAAIDEAERLGSTKAG